MALRHLKSAQAALGRAEELIAMGLVVALLLVVNLQIFARYIFHHPFIWPEEVSRLLLVWITFVGGAALTRRGGDLAVDTFVEMLPPTGRRVMLMARDTLMVVVFTTVAVQGFSLARAVNNMPLVATGWPTAMLAWPLIGGGALVVLHCLIRLVEQVLNPAAQIPHTPSVLT